MKRAIIAAVLTGLLIIVGAGHALACNTGEWLLLGGRAWPGTTVGLTGGGLDAGRVVLVWDRPTGQVVGEGDVSPDGRLTTEVDIPAAAAGRHKIIAVGAAVDDSPTDSHAWTDVVIGTVAAEASAASKDADPPRSRSGRFWVLAAVAVALAAAVGVSRAARRRLDREAVAVPFDDVAVEAELQLLLSDAAGDTSPLPHSSEGDDQPRPLVTASR